MLQEQRKIIEYESSDLRSGGSDRKGHAHLTESQKELNNEDAIEEKASRCLVHNSSTHDTGDCRVFQEKSPENKILFVKEKRACWSCLKSGHRSVNCKSCGRCGIDGCFKFHHPSLHLAHVQGIAFHTPTISKREIRKDSNQVDPCLLQVMKIKSSNDKDPLSVLWDGGLVFNCLASRAVYVDISTDYSTEGFLMVTRRFVSLRGFPRVIFSDCGSQLVAADKELKAVIRGLDEN